MKAFGRTLCLAVINERHYYAYTLVDFTQKSYCRNCVTFLQREFRSASAELTRRDGDILGAHLIITQNLMDKRVLSVDNRGKVIEYEIYYILNFKLLDKDGQSIMPAQRINMTRDYPFASTDVLGSSHEERLLRKDMYQDMARQIMRRIQAQTN